MFKEQLFAISTTPAIEPVETPIGRAYVRTISAGEKDRLEQEVNKDPSVSFRARLIVLSACKEDGSPEFAPGDVHRIADYPVYLVEPLIEAAIRVNKMSKEDVEGLEKNSNGRARSSSTS